MLLIVSDLNDPGDWDTAPEKKAAEIIIDYITHVSL